MLLGIFSILLIVLAFLYRNNLGYFKKYGYLGIFIISVIGNIAIFSPAAPLASVLGGKLYNPWIVSFVTALGAIIGEIVSYTVGYASQDVVYDLFWYEKIKYFMEINGSITIFLLATIPNPFFDLAGIAAGATNFPFWKFILFSFLGKWIKFGMFALLGHTFKHHF